MFSAANYVTGVNAMIPKAQMFNPAPAKWISSRLCLYWSQCHDPKTQCSILHRKNEVYSAADYVYTGVNAMIPKHNVQSCTVKNLMYSAVNCHSIQIDDPQSAGKHKLRSKLTAISPGAQVPEILWPMPRFCVKHVVLILSRVRG